MKEDYSFTSIQINNLITYSKCSALTAEKKANPVLTLFYESCYPWHKTISFSKSSLLFTWIACSHQVQWSHPSPLFSNWETTSTNLIWSSVTFWAPQYKKDMDTTRVKWGLPKRSESWSTWGRRKGWETRVCSAFSREDKRETLLLSTTT